VLFNVAQLLQEPIGAERSAAIAGSIPGVTADTPATDVTGSVRLVRTNRGLLAYADVHAMVRETCSRCLQPAELPLHVELAEEFLPTVDVHTGQPMPPPDAEEDAFFRIDEHHHLDLTEAIRQALVMEQPMRPLCRPECAGLCPRCGADRNAGPCGCADEPADDRWAVLRGLNVKKL
jgi:uncharacterized protein